MSRRGSGNHDLSSKGCFPTGFIEITSKTNLNLCHVFIHVLAGWISLRINKTLVIVKINYIRFNAMSQLSPFITFGSQHLVTVLVIVAAMVAIPFVVRKSNSEQTVRVAALALAIMLLTFKIGEPLFRLFSGESWQALLPLQLCDIGAFITGLVLLKQNMLLFELAYFWGLGGGIQAVLTPDLETGFPSSDFMFYFITHGLCMVGVIYAIVLFNYRPVLKSIWRAFLAMLVYAVLIIPVNWILGTNYLYLMQKPQKASLIDYLGDWPWYILSLVGVAIMIFFIYYSPFLVADSLRRKNK